MPRRSGGRDMMLMTFMPGSSQRGRILTGPCSSPKSISISVTTSVSSVL